MGGPAQVTSVVMTDQPTIVHLYLQFFAASRIRQYKNEISKNRTPISLLTVIVCCWQFHPVWKKIKASITFERKKNNVDRLSLIHI